MSHRQSIYPRPPPISYWSTLESCSQSLTQINQSIHNGVITLERETRDFTRLASVIGSRRCFEVVTESEIRGAQRDVAAEIKPQIKQLIERTEVGLEILKMRDSLLRSKVEKRANNLSTGSTVVRSLNSLIDLEVEGKKLKALRAKRELLTRKVEGL